MFCAIPARVPVPQNILQCAVVHKYGRVPRQGTSRDPASEQPINIIVAIIMTFIISVIIIIMGMIIVRSSVFTEPS